MVAHGRFTGPALWEKCCEKNANERCALCGQQEQNVWNGAEVEKAGGIV